MRTTILVVSFLTSSYLMAAPAPAPAPAGTPKTVAPKAAVTASAPQQGPCVDQGYADPAREPNYECRGPGEDMLVPEVNPQPSIPVAAGIQPAAQKYDAILMDKVKVVDLGLRMKALRRLRWLDLHRSSDLLAIEQRYLRSTSAEKDKLAASQTESYKQQLLDTQAALTSERAWYRSWTFGLIVGVVTTAAAVTSVAIAIR